MRLVSQFTLLVCALIVHLTLGLSLSSAKAENLNIQTDTSWRAIGPDGDQTGGNINTKGLVWEAANTGWNSSLSFDDSDSAGWTNAIAVVHPNAPFTRYWVDGTETVGSSPAYFRKEFFIAGIPTAGLFDIGVDDDFVLYINGSQVFAESNGLATTVNNINVLAFLVPGSNLIAVKAHDVQGAQSLNANLDVTFTPAPVPEPSSAILFLIGMLSCGIIWRSRNGTAKKI